jgi:hypothetical protein
MNDRFPRDYPGPAANGRHTGMSNDISPPAPMIMSNGDRVAASPLLMIMGQARQGRRDQSQPSSRGAA